MITASTKRQGILVVLFFVCSVSLFGGLLYMIEVVRNDVEVMELERQRNERFANELRSLERLVTETTEERAELNTYILSSGDENVIDFILLLESLGDEQGAVLTIKSLQPSDIGGDFEQIDFSIEVVGSYESVTYILDMLETLPYQSSVSSMQVFTLGGAEADMWKGLFTVHVTKFKKI